MDLMSSIMAKRHEWILIKVMMVSKTTEQKGDIDGRRWRKGNTTKNRQARLDYDSTLIPPMA